jgi:hypothetical protein
MALNHAIVIYYLNLIIDLINLRNGYTTYIPSGTLSELQDSSQTLLENPNP